MDAEIQSTMNTRPQADVSGAIELNASTSVKIADAKPRRIAFFVSNPSAISDVWIKFQPATTDNDKKGILLPKGESKNIMPENNVYTGEISAISQFDSPSIYVTEI